MQWVAGLALLLSFLGSCAEETQSCTTDDCFDRAWVTIHTETGEWEVGEYALRLSLDAEEHSCAFTLPADFPATTNAIAAVECTPWLKAYFYPELTCGTQDDRSSSAQSCTPIPNAFYLGVWVDGVPASAAVVLEGDADVLIDEVSSLDYSELRPNGPDCGPVCRQGAVGFVVP